MSVVAYKDSTFSLRSQSECLVSPNKQTTFHSRDKHSTKMFMQPRHKSFLAQCKSELYHLNASHFFRWMFTLGCYFLFVCLILYLSLFRIGVQVCVCVCVSGRIFQFCILVAMLCTYHRLKPHHFRIQFYVTSQYEERTNDLFK